MEILHMDTQNPDETIIKIEGIRRPLTFMHFTDFHVTDADHREEERVLEAAERRKQVFGNTVPHFENAIRMSNDWQVDCTVFTGDIIDFPSVRNVELMEEQFRKLHAPYLFTLGNHDWRYPHLRPNDTMRDKMYPVFDRFTLGNPSHQAFDVGGVRLIVVDNSNYQISEEQLNFVKAKLDDNIPCLLFFHIPLYLPTLAPMVNKVWKSPIMVNAQGWDTASMKKWKVREPDNSTKEFHRFITSGESKLAAIFCGHVHFSHKDCFVSDRYQYVTRPGFQGGYRKITVQPLEFRRSP